jgi:lipopolysaccharide/colanic/teichoic acid biosynthesis glycosyltransferase
MSTSTLEDPRLERQAGVVSPAIEAPRWYAAVRVAADTVVAFTLLMATLPLILVLLAVVKLTSRGPALYSQVRQGRRGRPYMIYKIRSMYHDCERDSGPTWALTDDPRVTPVGRFLRKTHLDELPQLWNVLRGDMSLIGPRPERPELAAELGLVYPNFSDRLLVRPGITGLAQVQLPADSDLPGVGRKLACDLCYIRRMGPWLDARILIGTVMKILGVPLPVIRERLTLPPWEEARKSSPAEPTVRDATVGMAQAS